MATAEFIDLVQQTLELDGTFSLLRAQLRASVQKVIEGKAPVKSSNEAYQTFVERDDGKQALLLVRDLLESLSLTQTLQTFDAETGLVISIYMHPPICLLIVIIHPFCFQQNKQGRATLAAELGLPSGSSEPLLTQVLRGKRYE